MSNGSGATQCPKCGAVGTYRITMQNGGPSHLVQQLSQEFHCRSATGTIHWSK